MESVKKKRINQFLILLLITISILIIIFLCIYLKKGEKENPLAVKYNIDLNDNLVDFKEYKPEKINLKESLVITKGGIYELSGNLNNGNITINTLDNVKLILNNVNISSENSPAIIVNAAKNVLIELPKETSNYLTDGLKYTGSNSLLDGVIYSKSDLIFQGLGKLVIKANHGDGIVSKDDLKINNGIFDIMSADDGIRGKDSVYILDGKFKIVSQGDGIKSSNKLEPMRGFILIEDGYFDINSKLDGLTTETKLIINDGEFHIKTYNEKKLLEVNSLNPLSVKGIKSLGDLHLNGGEFFVDAMDDAVFAKNKIFIKNAKMELSSLDEAIRTSSDLNISGGKINILKSRDAIKALNMIYENGDLNIISSDDGLNIGSISSTNESSNSKLLINNGKINIDSLGNVINIHGTVFIKQGFINIKTLADLFICDNEINIQGGTIISLFNLEGKKANLENGVYQINLNNMVKLGDVVKLVDMNNIEILNFKVDKSTSQLSLISDKLLPNKKYQLFINNILVKELMMSDDMSQINLSK